MWHKEKQSACDGARLMLRMFSVVKIVWAFFFFFFLFLFDGMRIRGTICFLIRPRDQQLPPPPSSPSFKEAAAAAT